MFRLRFAHCLLAFAAAAILTPNSAFAFQEEEEKDKEKSRPGRMTAEAFADERPGMSARSKSRSDSKAKSETKKKAKFQNLLETKDLSNFRGYKTESIGEGWSVKGKTLYFDGTKGTGDIITKNMYSDFELQFDWKISPGGNSGVMYHVGLGDAAPYITGIEYQVLDDSAHPDGKNEKTSAGAIYALYPPDEYKKKPVGGWNKSRIVVSGSSITHYLNGKKIVTADMSSDDWSKRISESKFKDWEKFATLPKGHIAFQDHGDKVWYRNIKVKDTSENPVAVITKDDKEEQKRPGVIMTEGIGR